MAETQWSYQQYDPVTRTCFPVTEDGEEVTVYGVPDGYEAPIEAMFAARDARRARCRVVSFQ